MSETEQPERQSYRTLTEQDAVDLRVARVRELEREHFGFTLLAQETDGHLSPTQQRERAEIEHRILLHSQVLWPEVVEQPTPEFEPDPDQAPDVAAPVQRGTDLGPGDPALGGPLPDPIARPGDEHDAAHHDGPVEPGDPGDGSPLASVSELITGADDLDDTDDDPETGRHADPGDRTQAPSPLQRTSHFPSART